jgi:hypothetical protein
MTTDLHPDCAAVVEHLLAEFGGDLPRSLVTAVVGAAERELRGQIAPGSLGELLHRLAAFRLRQQAEGE